MTDNASLVAKVWNYAYILRDQGISCGDYVEQITYLLFLKMDQERSELLGESSIIPAEYRWDKLASQDGTPWNSSIVTRWKTSPRPTASSALSSVSHKTSLRTRQSSSAWFRSSHLPDITWGSWL